MNNEYCDMLEELQTLIVQCKTEKMHAKLLVFLDAFMTHPLVRENALPIQDALQELLKAYQNKDYMLVADLLEFVLKPILAEKAGY